LLISGDGRKLQVSESAAPIRIDRGEATGDVPVFRDVTKQYINRDKLRESEERLGLALVGANHGIWNWRLDHNAIHCAPRTKLWRVMRPNFRR